MSKGILYLIPNLIANSSEDAAFPVFNKQLVQGIEHFICENPKPFRALLKALGIPSPYDHLELFELNKHTEETHVFSFIRPLLEGRDMGLVSDAGCPGIADPGSRIVELAHVHGIEVIPMVGPSSIFMALMASGFNGQQFCFNGYLPFKEKELKQRLIELEGRVLKDGSSQIFIEAPYRNQKLFDQVLKTLSSSTKLCVAYDLMGESSRVRSLSIADWRKHRFVFDKQPCVFILGR